MELVKPHDPIFGNLDMSSFTEEDRILIEEIKWYFSICQEKERLYGSDFSKPYIVFAFNFFELDLPEKALLVLDKIHENYFGQDFLNDIRLAESNWQEAEKLKNKINTSDQERFTICRQEAEFFIVAFGLIAKLSMIDAFPKKKNFNQFRELLKNQTFEIKVLPKIGLVSHN